MAVLAHWWASWLRWWHAINWDPNWVGAIGQWAGAIGTVAAVIVALRLARWERRRDMTERRDREAAQARLVTMRVLYPSESEPVCPDGEPPWPSVQISNYSQQPVYRLRIESMGDYARPPVHWGIDPNTGEDRSEIEVFPPSTRRDVPFDHVDPLPGCTYTTVTTVGRIKKRVNTDNVTITFIDTSGLRWRRTGIGEPVRVFFQSTLGDSANTECTSPPTGRVIREAGSVGD